MENNLIQSNKLKCITIIICIVAISFTRCTTNDKIQNYRSDFSEQDFKIHELHLKDADSLSTGDLLFRRPKIIQVINDSILAIADTRNKNLVALLNHYSNKGKVLTIQGKGPTELSEVTTMLVRDSLLTLSGLNDGKILHVGINADSLSGESYTSYHVPFQPLRSLMINDSVCFALSQPFSGHRFSVYNVKDSTTNHFDSFPLDSVDLELKPDNVFIQADMGISPDSDYIVLANRSWPIIEIINIRENKINRLTGPAKIDGKVKRVDYGNSYTYSQTPGWDVWNGLTVGDKYIYVGYSGYRCEPNQKYDNPGISKIYSFSMTGEPEKIFVLDSPIETFTIDEKNGYIYVVRNNPDPSIFKYKL